MNMLGDDGVIGGAPAQRPGEHGALPTLVVAGSCGSRGDHEALGLLAAAAGTLVDPVVAVTCGPNRGWRVRLADMSLQAAGADGVPVLEAVGCRQHPTLPFSGPRLDHAGVADQLADAEPEDMSTVVLPGGALATVTHALRPVAVADVDSATPGACPPWHDEYEARRKLGTPTLRPAVELAAIGRELVLPEAFRTLHTPEHWVTATPPARDVGGAPRSVRDRADAPLGDGDAQIAAVMSGLVFAVHSVHGKDRRPDAEIAREIVELLKRRVTGTSPGTGPGAWHGRSRLSRRGRRR
jgi:hypothetical protein